MAEIDWSHNIIILEKCKDDLEREFYIPMAPKFGVHMSHFYTPKTR